MAHIVRGRRRRTLAEAEREDAATRRRRARRRDVIRLGRRKRRKPKSKFLRILTSPKTTLALGATLAGLLVAPAAIGRGVLFGLRGLGRGFFGTPKRAFLTATGIGILQTSPKARTFLKEKLRDPTAGGRILGGVIEDPSQLFPTAAESPFGRVGEFAKRAGIVGAGAALAAGAVATVQRFRERRAARAAVIPSAVLPTGILPATPSLTPRTEPLGAVEKETPVPISPPPLRDIPRPIKITNKPQINISFRKSRRFINQQVLVR